MEELRYLHNNSTWLVAKRGPKYYLCLPCIFYYVRRSTVERTNGEVVCFAYSLSSFGKLYDIITVSVHLACAVYCYLRCASLVWIAVFFNLNLHRQCRRNWMSFFFRVGIGAGVGVGVTVLVQNFKTKPQFSYLKTNEIKVRLVELFQLWIYCESNGERSYNLIITLQYVIRSTCDLLRDIKCKLLTVNTMEFTTSHESYRTSGWVHGRSRWSHFILSIQVVLVLQCLMTRKYE